MSTNDMKNNKLYKITLSFLVLFVVILCCSYYFVFSDIKNKNSHASELQNNIDLQIRRDQYIMSVDKVVKSANNDIGRVDGSILKNGDEVGFIELLEGLAKKNSLDISIDHLDLDNISSLADTDMTSLDIKAQTKGDWAGTYSFMNELESLPFVSRVDKFALMSVSDGPVDSKKSSFNGQWQIIFEIHVLKQK
jgi:hypothetical protein